MQHKRTQKPAHRYTRTHTYPVLLDDGDQDAGVARGAAVGLEPRLHVGALEELTKGLRVRLHLLQPRNDGGALGGQRCGGAGP